MNRGERGAAIVGGGVRRRGLCRRALVIGLLGLARPALAEPSAAEVAVAQRLFREASALREAEKWAAAAERLREAIALKETPGLRFHLAHCEEKLGRLVEAQIEYDRAGELIAAGAKAPDVLPLLEPARSALRERVPTLRLRLAGGATAARLSIDAVALSPRLLDQAVPLNPGEHRVQVEAEGRAPSVFTVALEEGEERTLDVSLGAPVVPAASGAGATPRAALPVPASTSAPRPAELGLREGVLVGEGVVALAGAGLGVYFLVEKGDATDRVDAANREIPSGAGACRGVDAPPSCEALLDAAQDRQRASDWALGALLGAGAGATALVVTWLLWPAEPSVSRHGGVFLIPSPGGAVVGSAGRF